jgi:hypothetical protein
VELSAIWKWTYGGVKIVPDTTLTGSSPFTHAVVRVVRSTADGCGQKVTPTLAHTTTLTPTEATGVRRSTGQAGAQTVGKLVDNDASLQVTIPVRISGVPEEHPAATVLTVRWGHEVGIVVTTAILSIGNNTIIFLTTSAKVVLLEIARWLIESVTKGEVS